MTAHSLHTIKTMPTRLLTFYAAKCALIELLAAKDLFRGERLSLPTSQSLRATKIKRFAPKAIGSHWPFAAHGQGEPGACEEARGTRPSDAAGSSRYAAPTWAQHGKVSEPAIPTLHGKQTTLLGSLYIA
jgi:hypothetical protein